MAKPKPARLPDSCTVIRRIFVRTGTMNLVTGSLAMNEGGTWVTRPCNTPLFDARKATGKCRSCSEGWEVEENRPATEAEIAEYKAAPFCPSCGRKETRLRARVAGEACGHCGHVEPEVTGD